MQKLDRLEQLDEGKLYSMETIHGERIIAFRENDIIRSNAQTVEDNNTKPLRSFSIKDIVSYEEISKK